ncbi:MAG: SUMF1/EgtB/PvdO family nonheme iron enzyme [Acidobacteriota bacterium]
MHGEAFHLRAADARMPPRDSGRLSASERGAGAWPGDVEVPGGTFRLGPAPGEEPFVFDNEKWGRGAAEPFAIARVRRSRRTARCAPSSRMAATSGASSGATRAGGGASRPGAHPCTGAEKKGAESQCDFDHVVALEPHRPVIHVGHHEAEAYCAWAGRRLPTEAQVEAAAAAEPDGGRLSARKRRFPLGRFPADRGAGEPRRAGARLRGRRRVSEGDSASAAAR